MTAPKKKPRRVKSTGKLSDKEKIAELKAQLKAANCIIKNLEGKFKYVLKEVNAWEKKMDIIEKDHDKVMKDHESFLKHYEIFLKVGRLK